jgi:Ca2+-binding RTX toxin-like protein
MPRRLTVAAAAAVLGAALVGFGAQAHAADETCFGRVPTIVGTEGDDALLLGTPGDDVIAGLGGNDNIRGLGGTDLICGGLGKDFLIAGPSDDHLDGGPGDDTLRGELGSDVLLGGDGADMVSGDGDNGRPTSPIGTRSSAETAPTTSLLATEETGWSEAPGTTGSSVARARA